MSSDPAPGAGVQRLSPALEAAPHLEIEGLSKRFGHRQALSNVSLTVAAGEIVGLVGTSGSGKSTLVRCIVGLERRDAGRILWRGEPLPPSGPDRATRRAIQIVFQDPRGSLNPRWTIRRTLSEPLTNWGRMRRDRLDAAVHTLLTRVELPCEYRDRYPHELSTGQCQRICIARALATEPSLLLLDEPLSALDVSLQVQMLELLRRLHAELGVSMLFVSHDLPVVADLCQRVVVLRAGEVVDTLTREQFLAGTAHPFTRALIADSPVSPARLASSPAGLVHRPSDEV
ncbi:MAG: ABC transporter ATP-binding protein [Chloroflexi bacterium]|nr:ABC transporter ATP-binding protein [Chloroflexota bacterium]